METWVKIIPIALSVTFAVIGFLTHRLISALDRQIVELKKSLIPLGNDLKEATKELHGVQKELQFMWRVLDDKKHNKDGK